MLVPVLACKQEQELDMILVPVGEEGGLAS